jgi:hypothetical protein
MRKSLSSRVAFCGIFAALCIVLMLIAGLVQIATFAIPVIAGALLMVLVIELGLKYALSVYIAVSVFSILFVADKEAALIFTLFFGYYPILKSKLDIISQKILSWVFKLLIFNAAMITEYFIAIKVLMVPDEEFMMFGVSLPLILLGVANIMFVIYDFALLRVVIIYYNRFRGKLNFFKK